MTDTVEAQATAPTEFVEAETLRSFARLISEQARQATRQEAQSWFIQQWNQKMSRLHSASRQLHQGLRESLQVDNLFSEQWWSAFKQNPHMENVTGGYLKELQEAAGLLEIVQILRETDDPGLEMQDYVEGESGAKAFHDESFVENELRLLVREWGHAIRFDNSTGRPTITLSTESIEFSEDGVTVCFEDGFDIILCVEGIGRSPDAAITVQPCGHGNYAYGGDSTPHPHVQDGSVCFGTAFDGVNSALKNGLISDLFRLMDNLIHTYNPHGPFVSIRNWYGERTSCCICGEGLCEDDDDTVYLDGDGHAHAECCEYDDDAEEYYNPNRNFQCSVCGTSTRGSPRHFGSTRAPVCGNCSGAMEEAQRVQNEGGYACPSCRHIYTAEEVDSARNPIRIVLGWQDYACPHCATEQEDGSYKVTDWFGNDRVVMPRPDERDIRNHTRMPVPPVFPIRQLVSCTCGARVAEGMLRTCEMSGDHCCDHCDPDHIGLARTAQEDIAYLESWWMTFQGRLDEFSRDFMQFASFYDGFSPAEAYEIVRRLELRRRNNQEPISGWSGLITDKLAWFNAAVADLDVVIVHAIEGDQHDEQVISTWRRRAEQGDEGCRERLNQWEAANRIEVREAVPHPSGHREDRQPEGEVAVDPAQEGGDRGGVSIYRDGVLQALRTGDQQFYQQVLAEPYRPAGSPDDQPGEAREGHPQDQAGDRPDADEGLQGHP